MAIQGFRCHDNFFHLCLDKGDIIFVLLDDRIIVQLNELDASAKSDEIDNVYAVDMEGNIIWRIQNKERVCPEYKFISPYVMINYIDGELIVNDFNGFRFLGSEK